MSEVASLELCKELYELSGWENTLVKHITSDEHRHFDEKLGVNTVNEKTVGLRENNTVGCDECEGAFAAEYIPAYSLGYLLRKLPANTSIRHNEDGVYAVALHQGVLTKLSHADTPENACAKLAIELLKQGIL